MLRRYDRDAEGVQQPIPNRRRDSARGLIIGSQFRAGFRNLRCVQTYGNKHTVYVTKLFDISDSLLIQIAALGKADRLIVSPDFLRQIVLGSILPVERGDPTPPEQSLTPAEYTRLHQLRSALP